MKISAVIPVFNEEKNLNELYQKLTDALSNIQSDYEIIFVDDGSTDRSFEVIGNISSSDNKVSSIKFSRNYGQTAALQAGFQKTVGEIVVTLDADLQNNPENIPDMVEELRNSSADVISGWRYPRQDSLPRKIVSGIANYIISKICGLKLHDYGCTLKVYKSKYIKDLRLFGEMHRFIPAFIYWNGGKVQEMKVKHSPRLSGKSSYGMGRIYRVILDLLTTKFLTTYATKPIHVFGSIGLGSIGLGIIVTIYVIIRKIYMGGEWISPLFFISVFLGGLGLILIFMGIIAEITVRIYFSQSENPPYRIQEVE